MQDKARQVAHGVGAPTAGRDGATSGAGELTGVGRSDADPVAALPGDCRGVGLTAYEQLNCGCHVHVEVASDEEGVGVIDRIRPWPAGYVGYRYQAWRRWPTAGPTEVFGSSKAYRAFLEALLATGTLLDVGMIYFDARLSHHCPTVEIRVADVCLEADDTVLLAALVRGLVETAAREWRTGFPPDPVSARSAAAAARNSSEPPTPRAAHRPTWCGLQWRALRHSELGASGRRSSRGPGEVVSVWEICSEPAWADSARADPHMLTGSAAGRGLVSGFDRQPLVSTVITGRCGVVNASRGHAWGDLGPLAFAARGDRPGSTGRGRLVARRGTHGCGCARGIHRLAVPASHRL